MFSVLPHTVQVCEKNRIYLPEPLHELFVFYQLLFYTLIPSDYVVTYYKPQVLNRPKGKTF